MKKEEHTPSTSITRPENLQWHSSSPPDNPIRTAGTITLTTLMTLVDHVPSLQKVIPHIVTCSIPLIRKDILIILINHRHILQTRASRPLARTRFLALAAAEERGVRQLDVVPGLRGLDEDKVARERLVVFAVDYGDVGAVFGGEGGDLTPVAGMVEALEYLLVTASLVEELKSYISAFRMAFVMANISFPHDAYSSYCTIENCK